MALVCPASAVRVGNGVEPAASAVQAAAQEPAQAQADESASLRQGTIAAVDERRGRLQVQGLWLDVVPDKTKLIRHGRPATLDTLRAGEAIRFTVAPGRTAPSLGVIYVP
ncbi:MAG: hypothetical protein ACXWUL_00375 [Caldimonas sp.]